MKIIGIVGYGEVGSSLHKVYKNNSVDCKIKDSWKNHNDDFSEVQILNICIPYLDLENFICQVKEYIHDKPELVLIHSSIGLGVIKNSNKCIRLFI